MDDINILIVDDEEDFARGISRLLSSKYPDCSCKYVTSIDQALDFLHKESVALVLTDLRMPGKDGWDMLKYANGIQPETSLVVITAYGSIEGAVRALKSGAYDFLTKPLDEEYLFRVVDKVIERYQLILENRKLRDKVRGWEEKKLIIGESPAMQKLMQNLEMIAEADYNVLLRGESGTGKELAARVIHNLSNRRDNPMVTVNCPAIPGQLLESELFGHVRGAFTGADKDRQGLFIDANKGTLLLDEIGDITPEVQSKLLRVLQNKEIRPVGGNESTEVDVRIIATTNQDLEGRIARGKFREDLFYRLNVLNVFMPPLRERKEDISLLVTAFLDQACREMNIRKKEIDTEALAYLSTSEWRGNVRELLNFVRRLVVFSQGERIGLDLIHFLEASNGKQSWPADGEIMSYKTAKAKIVDRFSENYVREMLGRTGGNVSEAARLSGLERVSLQKIMRRLNIDPREWKTVNAE